MQDKQTLLHEMCDLGLAKRVAENLLQRFEPDYLRTKLAYARYAARVGLAENPPGWFVCSVKENWPAPLGYQEGGKPKPGSEEDRKRYITGKYAHLVQH